MNTAFKISPLNLLSNWGYVEDWSEGDSSAPTGWTMDGTAGSVAKESTEKKFGSYSMKIVSGSADSYKSKISIVDCSDYSLAYSKSKTIERIIRDQTIMGNLYCSYHCCRNDQRDYRARHIISIWDLESIFY